MGRRRQQQQCQTKVNNRDDSFDPTSRGDDAKRALLAAMRHVPVPSSSALHPNHWSMGDKSPKNIHKQEDIQHHKKEEKVHHKHVNAEVQHHHPSENPEIEEEKKEQEEQKQS